MMYLIRFNYMSGLLLTTNANCVHWLSSLESFILRGIYLAAAASDFHEFHVFKMDFGCCLSLCTEDNDRIAMEFPIHGKSRRAPCKVDSFPICYDPIDNNDANNSLSNRQSTAFVVVNNEFPPIENTHTTSGRCCLQLIGNGLGSGKMCCQRLQTRD